MKTIHKITLFYLLLIPMISLADPKEIPFTLEDRDRMIRTEQKVDNLLREMSKDKEIVDSRFNATDSRFDSIDSRFDSLDSRMDQLFNFLWVITSIFTAMTISVFGFAFWDRKISLNPVKRENKRIISVLTDFSESEPRLHEILRKAGML